MKYTIPQDRVCRYDAIRKCLETIYCDSSEETGYGYMSLVDKEVRLKNHFQLKNTQDYAPYFLALVQQAQTLDEQILKKDYELNTISDLKERAEEYDDNLTKICAENGRIRVWATNNKKDEGISKNSLFTASILFTILLTHHNKTEENRARTAELARYLLGLLGITEVDESIIRIIANPSFAKCKMTKKGSREIYELCDRSADILFMMIGVMCFLCGNKDKDAEGAVAAFHQYFADMFAEEILLSETVMLSQRRLYECVRYFSPRTVDLKNGDGTGAQDIFVIPHFEACESNPFSMVNGVKKSRRLIIKGKTGLGKSTFLKVGALCTLQKVENLEGESARKLEELAEKMGVARDMLVLFVPAKMFTDCCGSKEQQWAEEFDLLFFQYMWKRDTSIQFFQDVYDDKAIAKLGDAELAAKAQFTEEIGEYLLDKAKSGKLLLILDSFDEINGGMVRTAYLNALSRFVRKYCSFDGDDEVGAHIILSTREMSAHTMDELENALGNRTKKDSIYICGLDETQQKELIAKLKRYSVSLPDDVDDMMRTIQANRYYKEYAENPYLLSVLCFFYAKEIKDMVKLYIDFLAKKMQENNLQTSLQSDNSVDMVIGVLMNKIIDILQGIAVDTITQGKSYITKNVICEHITNACAELDLSEETTRKYVQYVQALFVEMVGLIVPADGRDEDYQFINEQVRYYLAARGIISSSKYHMVEDITRIEDYVGTMIPLLALLDQENNKVAFQLIEGYAMHDFADEKEDGLLIAGLIDLLLKRYGSNCLTLERVGLSLAGNLKKAQRIAIMRLLTSRSFEPTEDEIEKLELSPAYLDNMKWISDALRFAKTE